MVEIVDDIMRRIKAHSKQLLQSLVEEDQEAITRIREVSKIKLLDLEARLHKQVREEELEMKQKAETNLKKFREVFSERTAQVLDDLDIESKNLEDRLKVVVEKACSKRERRLQQHSREISQNAEYYIQSTMRFWQESMRFYEQRRISIDSIHRLQAEQRLDHEDAIFKLVLQAKMEFFGDYPEEEVAQHLEKHETLMAVFSSRNYELNEEALSRLEEMVLGESITEELVFG